MNGRLNLSTAFDGQKTVTEDLYFAPPFKVYSPFYDQKGWAKYISMCGSAGVLAGDKNEIKLVVRKNARLCYMPHPIMTFTGCEHISMGKVNITESSELIFSEIYCCGRTAMGEEFGLKRFRSRTEIAIDGRADFIDNTLIDPAALPIRQKGFFESFTHTGFMYIYTPDKTMLESIYQADYTGDPDSAQLCATHTERGIAIRTLGRSGEEIFDAFQNIAEKIRT